MNNFEELPAIRQLVNALDSDGEPMISYILKAPLGIKSESQRLGVFSASFNPLTNAHVKMIEEAKGNYNLAEILLVLAKANVDKEIFGLSLAERLLMIKLYAQKRPQFSVAACSHGRFVEKVKALRPLYPKGTEIYFIIGYDTLKRVFDPKYYTNFESELMELFSMSRFIVANRGGNDAEMIEKFLSREENQPYAEKIALIELTSFYANISSTEIRNRIQSGKTVDDLVPSEILSYLKETDVYSKTEVPLP
ncbi:TPA: nicotinate-nicotinamide nucleotide adenylyltransferase [Candidatus Poribacteria bacterium]|nr:nicotinate-nicotinamide nucleotide adenylyltransferase [Candidatus Poribacteria bacterium]